MSIQKTVSTIFCLLLWTQTTILRAQTTGVGINTENLQGVFHVDAAGNNPLSGSIPASQQADDIVVTEDGYAGVGTLAPSARLHIHTQGKSGIFPLRIADGSQGNNKMLTSDDDGVASWKTPPSIPPSSTIYPVIVMATQQSLPKGNTTKVNGSDFTAQEEGLYSLDVRFWGEGIAGHPNINTPATLTVTQFQLKRNGVVVDEYQYNEPSYGRLTVFVTLYAEASPGDELSLWVYPVEGYANLTIAPPPNYDQIKTRVLYKKLGVNDDTHYFD